MTNTDFPLKFQMHLSCRFHIFTSCDSRKEALIYSTSINQRVFCALKYMYCDGSVLMILQSVVVHITSGTIHDQRLIIIITIIILIISQSINFHCFIFHRVLSFFYFVVSRSLATASQFSYLVENSFFRFTFGKNSLSIAWIICYHLASTINTQFKTTTILSYNK